MKTPKPQQSLDDFFKEKLQNHQEPDLSALQNAMWQSVRPNTGAFQLITKYFILGKKTLLIVGSSAVLVGSSLLIYNSTEEKSSANNNSYKKNAVVIEKTKANAPIDQFAEKKDENIVQKPKTINIAEKNTEVKNIAIAPDTISVKKDSSIAKKDTVSIQSIVALQDSVNSVKAKKRIVVRRKVVVNDSVVKYQKRW